MPQVCGLKAEVTAIKVITLGGKSAATSHAGCQSAKFHAACQVTASAIQTCLGGARFCVEIDFSAATLERCLL